MRPLSDRVEGTTDGWIRVCLCVIIVLSSLDCRKADAPDAQSDSSGSADSSQPAELSPSELDRLRSLPYLGYSESPARGDRSGTVRHDPSRSYPGYNLYTVRERRLAELVDEAGSVRHAWQHGDEGIWERSVLLPDGNLLVIGRGAEEGQGRYLKRLAWDSSVVWQRSFSVHHDVAPTPDGRLAVLTYRRRHEPEYNAEHDIRDDCVTIVSPNDGSTLDERCLYDVLTSRPDLFLLDVRVLYKNLKFRGGILDLFHANSVRFMPASVEGRDDPIYSAWNVIVCIRHQDTVAIFDWEKGTLLWSWGQEDLSGPHDAVVLDNGNILIFDNGIGRDWSRVIELDPLTRQIVWEYRASTPSDFFSRTRGANQPLPNGNILITESEVGRAFEVTPDHDVVWEYLVPYLNEKDRRATIMRMYRYESEFVEGLLKARKNHPAAGAAQR